MDKKVRFIGGHVENLVLATYTPFPTSDYTNSMKKPALFHHHHICLQPLKLMMVCSTIQLRETKKQQFTGVSRNRAVERSPGSVGGKRQEA